MEKEYVSRFRTEETASLQVRLEIVSEKVGLVIPVRLGTGRGLDLLLPRTNAK